jgi:hypothetical protein
MSLFVGREDHISSTMTTLSSVNTPLQSPLIHSNQNTVNNLLNDTKNVEQLNPFADFKCKECDSAQMIEGCCYY